MNFKHGKCYTPTYRIWASMVARCSNPSCKAYPRYGGRGITVCEKWKTFQGFYSDMGERPPGKSLERQNNDLGYSPDNCSWVDRKTQNRNKRDNHLITLDGKTMTIAAWAEVCGLKYATLHQRIRNGWSAEDAIRTPLVKKRDRGRRKFGAEHGVKFQEEEKAA